MTATPPDDAWGGIRTNLPDDALRILATLTPAELVALDAFLFSACLYGADEGHAYYGAQKLHRAAWCCR